MADRYIYKVEVVKLSAFSKLEKNAELIEDAINRLSREGWEFMRSDYVEASARALVYLRKPG